MTNRQRRAAKARQRAARAGSNPRRSTGQDQFDGWAGSPELQLRAARQALGELVIWRAGTRDLSAPLDRFGRFGLEYQQAAVDDELLTVVSRLVAEGWNPHDLREVARRRVSAPLGEHLLGTVAEFTASHDRSRIDTEWLAQLDGMRPAASSRAWALRHQLAWPGALEQLIELLAALEFLPGIQRVTPPPGSRPAFKRAAHGVDERVLNKVRALLAKAESTEFDEEAEALMAKAQQLMTSHAIDRALADSTEPARERPTARRLWLDAPYVDAKSLLVEKVATGNRVRCVFTKELGFVTLVGFATDLDTVEMLSTSLLVQATRSMRACGSQTGSYGVSSTRSFRQSFLISFAIRIGERLQAAASEVETEADRQHGGALVPVLLARDEEVREAADALFPRLVAKSIRVSNRAGWTAGRVAADLASLDVRDAIGWAG